MKLLHNRPVFAPPKGGKERDVLLPESVAFALAGRLTRFPAAEVASPWKMLDGPPVVASLIFRNSEGLALTATGSTIASGVPLYVLLVWPLDGTTPCTRCGTSMRPYSWTRGRASRL